MSALPAGSAPRPARCAAPGGGRDGGRGAARGGLCPGGLRAGLHRGAGLPARPGRSGRGAAAPSRILGWDGASAVSGPLPRGISSSSAGTGPPRAASLLPPGRRGREGRPSLGTRARACARTQPPGHTQGHTQGHMGTHTTHKVASPVTHARGHAHIAGETPCWCPLARLGGPWKPLTPHHQYHFLPRPTDLLPLPPSATTLQAGPLSGFLFPASLWQIPVCPPPPDPSPSPPTPAGSFHTHPHLSQKHKGGCEVEERRGPAPEDGGEDFRGGEQAGEAERPCSQDQSHCGRKILQRAWQCRKGEGQDWGQGVPASHCYGDCGHLGWEGKGLRQGEGQENLTRKGFLPSWSRSPGWN